ncbi:hypothetical protein ABXK61_16300 [Burkholderia sola]|uniref:hypothetical protein n=1 Tax=Burkholderia TaxID=32008 RepID=UPI001AE1293A|nr:hypothetical protein [Burkholderia sp. AcTa6-5]MBP0714867.1 hypothetical protein [Burkholderia sp. AcTa6-5]
MKIIDDMLTEMEPIVSQWLRERGTCMDVASYAAALELAAFVAARSTTPDREAIIEECAKVCEVERLIDPTDSADDGAYDAARSDCAKAIRALKTVPASDQRGA